jgi:hypothetical protein
MSSYKNPSSSPAPPRLYPSRPTPLDDRSGAVDKAPVVPAPIRAPHSLRRYGHNGN